MCYGGGKLLPRKVKLCVGVYSNCVLLLQKRCAMCWCAGVQCVSLLTSLGLGRNSIQDKLLRNLRTNNLYVLRQKSDQVSIQQCSVCAFL